MPRWVSEFTVPPDDRDGTVGVKFEDGGMAAIMYYPVEDGMVNLDDPADTEFFVRLHSWNEDAARELRDHDYKVGHTLFRLFMGRKVRVTVETID